MTSFPCTEPDNGFQFLVGKFSLLNYKSKATQSCPTLCDPMDYTVHEILQARTLEQIPFTHFSILGLPWWLSWQRIHLQCRRPGFNPCVGEIPRRRERLPTPVFWPGEFPLYSPWGCKELDMTE